jgi:6,7-dimethyl-8-ribityllumazine synthase
VPHGRKADSWDEEARAVAADLVIGPHAPSCVVPGALEIPQVLAAAVKAGVTPLDAPNARFAGAIALGCVIRGDTSHYDTVCNNANHWLMEVSVTHCVPVGNGILTVENEAQAMERAKGGREGKGGDAARACLRLLEVARSFHGQNT